MALSLMTLVLGSTGFAQDAQLKRLNSGVDARAWEAVGRLDIGGAGFCTGALIAPRLVLTAAHCLFNRDTKERIDHGKVQFLAGWRNGRAGAYRDVRRAVVHPDFIYDGDVSSDRVRNDLALLELQRPIRNTTIEPFATAPRPRRERLSSLLSLVSVSRLPATFGSPAAIFVLLRVALVYRTVLRLPGAAVRRLWHIGHFFREVELTNVHDSQRHSDLFNSIVAHFDTKAAPFAPSFATAATSIFQRCSTTTG